MSEGEELDIAARQVLDMLLDPSLGLRLMVVDHLLEDGDELWYLADHAIGRLYVTPAVHRQLVARSLLRLPRGFTRF